MKRQEVNEKRKESPFQKINITYQNKSPEIKRSHSEYIRDKSPIFSVIHHHNIQ